MHHVQILRPFLSPCLRRPPLCLPFLFFLFLQSSFLPFILLPTLLPPPFIFTSLSTFSDRRPVIGSPELRSADFHCSSSPSRPVSSAADCASGTWCCWRWLLRHVQFRLVERFCFSSAHNRPFALKFLDLNPCLFISLVKLACFSSSAPIRLPNSAAFATYSASFRVLASSHSAFGQSALNTFLICLTSALGTASYCEILMSDLQFFRLSASSCISILQASASFVSSSGSNCAAGLLPSFLSFSTSSRNFCKSASLANWALYASTWSSQYTTKMTLIKCAKSS